MDKTGQLLNAIIAGVQEKKGKNISSLHFKDMGYTEWDHFVICEASSTTQVTSIADSVIEFCHKELAEKPIYKEGYTNSQWVLVDYGSIVVHIFLKEYREFYNLEGLWADAARTDIANLD